MVYSMDGLLVVAPGTLRWYPRKGGSFTEAHCALGVPSAGSSVGVRMNKNGVSVGSTTIGPGLFTSSFVPTPASFSLGDYFTVDVTQIGSGSPGADLVVQLSGLFS